MMFWAVWIVCGVLAYGIMKGRICRILEEERAVNYWGVYNSKDEAFCIFLLLAGMLGFIFTMFSFGESRYKFEFCYCIPEKFRRPMSR